MFKKALPVFAKGKQNEKNLFTTFVADTDCLMGAELHICAADFYSLYVNGSFVAFGPARTARGYARMDIIDLTPYHVDGTNTISINVAHYNCCSLSTVRQAGYLMCEVIRDREAVLWTGRDFDCYLSAIREQKVQRYSVQRHFTEVWDMTKAHLCQKVEQQTVPSPKVIDRRAPYPHYEDVCYTVAASRGIYEEDGSVVPKQYFYSKPTSERWGCFSREEEVSHPFEWVQKQKQTVTELDVALPLELRAEEYAIFDLDRIETGFISLNATASETSDIVIAFSEDAHREKFEFTDMHAHNVVEIILARDKHESFLSFEPYTMKYVFVAVRSGSVSIESLGIKTFVGDVSSVVIPDIKDETLRNIYKGAVRTYSHNAVDLYTDCPSRERGGWLCDSYFTAKTEYELFGTTLVEDAFLENYRLFDGDAMLPEGVIPMTYPSEIQDDGTYIPQWTMWYILEVEDYVNNRGHRADAHLFKDSIDRLLDFYEGYLNSDGLLERLPSWNFVEWSRANEWTRDVSYPTNFLYAQVLECVYRLWGDEKYLERAFAVRRTAIEQAFDGRVFLDHSVRGADRELIRQEHCSEACQYYAILFGGIDVNEDKYTELRRLVYEVFGASRTEEHPEITEINAFIGAYLRLEALLKLGKNELVLKDLCDFFGNMESETGTLWEYRQRHGSRDHGFASYALVAMTKALGLSHSQKAK